MEAGRRGRDVERLSQGRGVRSREGVGVEAGAIVNGEGKEGGEAARESQ